MFAILFEALFFENQEEIHQFAGWEGGGFKGHKNCEQKFCEQAGVSYRRFLRLQNSRRGRGVTDRGATALKVLRGFRRFSEVFRDF